jgi:NADPH:quinone reductase-like Zn-dependent oxidoreductase
MTLMKAILCLQPGGPDNLVLGEAPLPRPSAGEVLIEVKASGLNGADLAQRQGA